MRMTPEMIAAEEAEVKELRPVVARLNILAADSDFDCHFRIVHDISGVAIWSQGEGLSAMSRDSFRELIKNNDDLAYMLLRVINKTIERSREKGYREGVQSQQRSLRELCGLKEIL